MSQPKFIITDTGWLRLGMVNLHKDLLEPGEQCLGGGYYEFDYLSSRLLLSGRSYDFGRPQWRWLDSLVSLPHIPASVSSTAATVRGTTHSTSPTSFQSNIAESIHK